MTQDDARPPEAPPVEDAPPADHADKFSYTGPGQIVRMGKVDLPSLRNKKKPEDS